MTHAESMYEPSYWAVVVWCEVEGERGRLIERERESESEGEPRDSQKQVPRPFVFPQV